MKWLMLPPTLLLAGLASTPWTLAGVGRQGEPEEFEEFEVFIEINATDEDAGLQGLLDGEAWSKAKISGPDGRTVFQLQPSANLKDQGVTEFAWESNEPEFDEFSLAQFLARFPAGEYTARGKTVDSDSSPAFDLESTTELTHDLPAGPEITSPEEEEEIVVTGENLKVSWEEVDEDYQGGPLGSDIVLYQVVCEFEDEETLRVFSVDVDPDVFCAEIPGDFLKPDREYKLEVAAREESGNQTTSEITFCTVSE